MKLQMPNKVSKSEIKQPESTRPEFSEEEMRQIIRDDAAASIVTLPHPAATILLLGRRMVVHHAAIQFDIY